MAATAQSHRINEGDRSGPETQQELSHTETRQSRAQGAHYRRKTINKHNQLGKISVKESKGPIKYLHHPGPCITHLSQPLFAVHTRVR